MQNRTGSTFANPTPDALPVTGSLPVSFYDALGFTIRRLGNVPADTYVTASSVTIQSVHLHGDSSAPRATLTVTALAGESATIALSAYRVDEYYDALVLGQALDIEGLVRRPFRDAPPFIQASAVFNPII